MNSITTQSSASSNTLPHLQTIPVSFHPTIITPTKSYLSQAPFAPTHSSFTHNSQTSSYQSHNHSLAFPPQSANPPPTSYDSYVPSNHFQPSFHSYAQTSFPPTLPPNPLPLSHFANTAH